MVVTILGISPGTRSIGIAVIEHSELTEWQVKTFKGGWSKAKLNHIISCIQDLLEHFKVSQIAIKETSPFQTSQNLKRLTDQIAVLSKKEKIAISHFSIHELKVSVGVQGKHSMIKVMELITEAYPMLSEIYLKERNNLNPYYVRMFEAIAAARMIDSKG